MIRPCLSAIAVAAAATAAMAGPLPDPPSGFQDPNPASVALGQLLFYDPILSGSGTVACATCHHPNHATGDGLSLGLGDGAFGVGPDRQVDPANRPEQRIPRHATALFNLGFPEFRVMFHDGRLEADPDRASGIRTPLGQDMVGGFASVLSAQTMFPVLSPDEMAGHYSESDIAQAVRQGFLTGPDGAWAKLSARVADIPAYRSAFDALIGPRAITFADISNAIADFMVAEWRADGSPFDRYLRSGDPLPPAAMRGMDLFYGAAGCARCHAGPFQTDHDFHAIAMPQFGPGKAARFERHSRDIGRQRITADPDDAYAFRTPSLRNVAQTAPYGHTGAFATLDGVVRHHLDPVTSLQAYDPAQAILPELPGAEDWRIRDDPAEMSALAAANDLAPMALSDAQIADILAFLQTLTDETSLTGRLGIPTAVPSGLPVDR